MTRKKIYLGGGELPKYSMYLAPLSCWGPQVPLIAARLKLRRCVSGVNQSALWRIACFNEAQTLGKVADTVGGLGFSVLFLAVLQKKMRHPWWWLRPLSSSATAFNTFFPSYIRLDCYSNGVPYSARRCVKTKTRDRSHRSLPKHRTFFLWLSPFVLGGLIHLIDGSSVCHGTVWAWVWWGAPTTMHAHPHKAQKQPTRRHKFDNFYYSQAQR